ncbi:MAG: FkbM family methyltransferase [Longimicrobiales bacterium]
MLRRLRIRLVRGMVRLVARLRRAREEMMTVLFNEYFPVPAVIRCDLGDHVLNLNPADQTITTRVLTEGHWNRPGLERALRVLEEAGALAPGKAFIDVGANIGTQSLYAMLSGKFGRAVAFEPEPGNLALLERNVADNGLEGPVEVAQMALGSRSGTATLLLHPTNLGAHSITSGRVEEPAGQLPVPVETLDQAMADRGLAPSEVGLIWLDVEGAEADVVSGMTHLLSQGVPVVFEHIFRGAPPADALGLFDTFAGHYTSVYRLQDEGLSVRPIESVDALKERGDFLVFGAR